MSDDNIRIGFDLKDYLQGMEKRLLADSKQRHEAHEKVTAAHVDSIHKRIDSVHKRIDDLRTENARNLTIFGIAVVIILTIFTAVVLPTVHTHNVTEGSVALEDSK